jgi:hypothetical protein
MFLNYVEDLNMSEEKFDFCISNPPYQMDVQTESASRRVSKDIFPDFQKLGIRLSKNTVMIYPATWQRKIHEGLGSFLIENGIYSSDTIPGEKIFNGIILPVSIVFVKEKYNGSILVNGRSVERNIIEWVDSLSSEILLKKTQKLKKIVSGTLDEISINNAEDCSLELSKEPIQGNNIKILLKRKPGKQPDSQIFYVYDKSFIKLYPNYPINKYKVAVRSRIFGRQAIFTEVVFTRHGGLGLQTRVFNPYETFGTTWALLKTFDSKEESLNYSRYLNTMCIANIVKTCYLKKSFARNVPDLEDYTDKNPIFTPDEELPDGHAYKGLDLDHRLYKLFDLTDEEIQIVENNE